MKRSSASHRTSYNSALRITDLAIQELRNDETDCNNTSNEISVSELD